MRAHTQREGDILFAYKTLALFPGLTGPGRKVGAALMDHYNGRTGRLDPGMGRLAKLTGYSRSAVIRAIEELTEGNPPLFFKERYGGQADTNAYTPNFPLFRQFESDWTQAKKERRPAPVTEAAARKERADQIEAARQAKRAAGGSEMATRGSGETDTRGSSETDTQTIPNNYSKRTSPPVTDMEPLQAPSEQVEISHGLLKKGDLQRPSALDVHRLVRSATRKTTPTDHASIARRQAEKRLSADIQGFGIWDQCSQADYELGVIAEMEKPGSGKRVLLEHIQGRAAA